MGFLAKLLKVIGYLPAILVGIEGLFGPKTGEQKRGAAVSLVGVVLGFAEGISNKDIVDNAEFQEGLTEAINGTVKMLNASVWHKG